MKSNLNALQSANDCVTMSAYQLRIKQVLCTLKSVLRGIFSSLTGCQIQSFSISYYSMFIGIPKSKSSKTLPQGGKGLQSLQLINSATVVVSQFFTSTKSRRN